MVEEVASAFETWYQQKYRRQIHVEVTQTSFQEAFEKAKAIATDPEADIWWGGPVSSFNDAVAGLLQYNSTTYKNEINLTCRGFTLLKDNRSTPFWYAATQYGLGVMYNKHVLDTLDLNIPNIWTDFLDRKYMKNVAMTEPVNADFTEPFIMLVLQSKMQIVNEFQNWTAGWNYLIKLSGSIREYGTDESDTALRVSSGYLPLAIVSDFYAYDKMEVPVPDINFTYLDVTVLQPDPIAIFKRGKYLSEAKAFVDFVLTQQAQSIIGKYLLPIRSDVTTSSPRINPFSSNFPLVSGYNKTFEEKLGQIVEDYYSVWITQKHSQVRVLWNGLVEVNATKEDNALANRYYELAKNNFTYIGRYLNRTYLDTIYRLTGNWTDSVKKELYMTQWNGVCTTTYANVAENIRLAKEAIG